MLSIIIPTRNAEAAVSQNLGQYAGERLIISDSGSRDATLETAYLAGAQLCLGSAGRGPQLARGAKFALLTDAEWMLFLHSDARLSGNWRSAITDHMQNFPEKVGYFRYAKQAKGFWPWLQSVLVSLRCWAWKLPYGDQGLLISRESYERVGGFSNLPLFEDVDIMNRLKLTHGRRNIRPLPAFVRTDISAYEAQGWWKRGWRNFNLLRGFQSGKSVEELMATYYRE